MSTNPTPAEDYRAIAAHFTGLVRGVTDPHTWDGPSPVEGWTARDVVRHLIDWFSGFVQDGASVRLPAGPSPDEDPEAAWVTFSNAVQELLEAPATAARTFRNPHTGEMPLVAAISQFFTPDVFMHTWDLARATGQDDTLDPARCADMLAGMEPIGDMVRASGQYGPRVAVPPGADAQTQFVGFIGRDPNWTAST